MRAFGTSMVLGALLAVPAAAQAEMDPGPFAEGSIRVSVLVGMAQQDTLKTETTLDATGQPVTTYETETNTAFILGLGGGYYIIDGLELGLEGEHWFNSDPGIDKVSPNVRYVLWFVPYLKPYVGALYRHVFIGDGYEDADSLGARGGAFFVSGGGSYFGGGVVYEKVIAGCRKGQDCDEWYPEIMLSFSF